MGCQKDIARQIIGKDGDYVLILKGNQGKLFDEVKDWFELAEKADFNNLEYDDVEHMSETCSAEERYYISSLSLDASAALKAVPGHWQVENTLHWALDMTFKEDASRIRRGNADEIMNVLRKLALNLVKNDTTCKASMKRKLKMRLTMMTLERSSYAELFKMLLP